MHFTIRIIKTTFVTYRAARCYISDDILFNGQIFLTIKDNSGEHWIPSMKSHKLSWKKIAHKILFEFFGLDCATQLSPLRVCKIWLPNHPLPCVYHVIYKLSIKADIKKRIKVKPNLRYRVQWLAESDLERLKLHGALRSPELVLYAKMTGDSLKDIDVPLDARLIGFFPPLCYYFTPPVATASRNLSSGYGKGQLIEIDEDCVVLCANDAGGAADATSAAPQVQLLAAAKYTRDDQVRLYREFQTLSFPAMYMGQQLFTQLMVEVGWQREACPDLYRAADVNGRGGLSFVELLCWCAATEPHTQHSGLLAEIRCRYIFRYYGDGDHQLHAGALQRLVAEARQARRLPVDNLSVLRDADLCYKQLGLSPGSSLPLSEFLRLVREMRLRGTSCLLRAPSSTLGYVTDLQEQDCIEKTAAVKEPAKTSIELEMPPVKVSTFTAEGGYSLARGVLQIQRGCEPCFLPVNDLDEEAVSRSAIQLLRASSTSLQLLAPHSLAADAIATVRYFASEIDTPTKKKAPWEWSQVEEANAFGAMLSRLTAAVQPICAAEPRLLHLSSPFYVIGDLHGNLEALLSMEASLWGQGALCPTGLLFLGDYVDRGLWGVELIAFLLALKLQRPKSLHLVRGNHETRDVQTMFTFFSECKNKFGETEGIKIWENINEVFDVLPLAAVVDNKVFCCHGGIPPPWLCARASAVARVPSPLPRPALQSQLAWELLWNDPVAPERISASLAVELAANGGFAANSRRGTGHLFEQRALDRFLQVNGFSHVIRAHQLHRDGFMCQMQGKLVSVFSSSHYCGGANDSGAVLLSGGRLRLIRIVA